MPSAPAARPFFNRRIAVVTSSSIGTSSETVISGVAESTKSSRSAEGVSFEWLRVFSLQRSVISAGVLHRLPSEQATEPFALLRVLPWRRFIARYAGLRLFFRNPDSASSANIISRKNYY